MPIYNQELLKYSGDTSKWWLIHVFGEDYYELPQDGILQPSGSNQYPYTTLCPNYSGSKGSAFIVDARYSVYFTFGTFVPSLEFRKFADVECAIVVPFNSISNQIISVSFSECIALGPVAIPEGSIIFLNRAKVGNVPHYYSTHNIKTTDFTAIDRETKLQQVKTWIKNQDGITAEISLSTNMTFSILADLTIGSLTIKDVHPIEFFKQFTTKSKYQSADVSVGDEVHSYSGQNYRLAAMQCFKKHKGYTDYQDSVFQLFCFHYHSQKVIDWLAKFNNLPIESREYFNKLTRLFYAEWLVYNQDGLSTIFDGVSTRTVQSINGSSRIQ